MWLAMLHLCGMGKPKGPVMPKTRALQPWAILSNYTELN